MRHHTKVYTDFFSIGEQDTPPCERCIVLGAKPINRSCDVHHTYFRGMGGDQTKGKEKDKIEKLVGLCGNCHDIVEKDPEENQVMKEWALRLDDRLQCIKILMFANI